MDLNVRHRGPDSLHRARDRVRVRIEQGSVGVASATAYLLSRVPKVLPRIRMRISNYLSKDTTASFQIHAV